MTQPEKPQTPSMDDKDTPSPPTRTHAEYEEDRAAGINTLFYRLGYTPRPTGSTVPKGD